MGHSGLGHMGRERGYGEQGHKGVHNDWGHANMAKGARHVGHHGIVGIMAQWEQGTRHRGMQHIAIMQGTEAIHVLHARALP